MACCKCQPKTRNIIILSIGFSLIALSVILVVTWPLIFHQILISQLSLQPNSKSYGLWKETPIPMYLDIYLFNLSNAAEVSSSNWKVKPNFVELGPYVFQEKHTRVDVVWNDNNTVSFKQIRNWKFVQELSNGNLNDKITNLNVIAAVVANLVKNQNIIVQKAVDIFMRQEGEKLFVTHTVDELLFSGYDDKLLKFVKNISIPGLNFPFTKFGWFVDREGNKDYDGLFTMYTGQDDFKKIGLLTNWNGKNNTGFYKGHCGDVDGTTGELWPPVQDNKTINLFASDMCSSVTLDLESDVEVKGIDGMKFAGTNRAFDNGSVYSSQKCFATGNYPNGVRDVSKCRFGAPAYLSFPHFYLADPFYREQIDGMMPDKTKHQLHLELEPSTGIPLGVEAKIQININIRKVPGISMFSSVNTMYLPMLWFNQRASLSDDLASQLKLLLTLPNFGAYTAYGFGSIGGIIILIGLVLVLNPNWKRGEDGVKAR